MGIFPQKETKYKDWTDLLIESLKAKGKLMRTPSYDKWLMEFENLHKDYMDVEITNTLTWYCAHLGEEHIPHAFSASSFRLKFPAIKKAMETADVGLKEVIDDDIKKKVDLFLDAYNWPIEIRMALSQIIQRTKDNWVKLKNNLYKLESSNREGLFIDSVINSKVYTFLSEWICFLGIKYNNLEHFTGNVNKLHFDIKSDLFYKSFWCEWSRSWTGDEHAFDSLLSKLKGE